jgi:hypothetical protein
MGTVPLAQQQMIPGDALRASGFCFAIIVTVIAAFCGGMPLLLLLLAVALGAHAYKSPESVVASGPLFLLAANVFLPSSARISGVSESWQLYFWAFGIFLITAGALLGAGHKIFLRLPRSVVVFLMVAVVSSAYGFSRGNEFSYVVRQLFGALLLVAYFALATRVKNDERFFRNLRLYGCLCAISYVVYYASVFSEYGIHREIGTVGTQGAILAILFAGRGGCRWWLAAGLMLLLPMLANERRGVAAFLLGIIIIWALRTRSVVFRGLAWAFAIVIVLVSLVPAYVEAVLDTATDTKMFDELLPEGGRDSASVQDRGMQLVGAAIVVNRSPVLGLGMGGRLEFESVNLGSLEEAYVDNGWAYLLTKMGIAGLLAFAWFVFAFLRWLPGNSVPLSACVLAMLLLVMFAEPVFFQFSTAPYMGAMVGLLYGRKLRSIGT